MPVYLYRAKNIGTGEKVKGQVEVSSEEMAYKYLNDKNLYPLSVRQKGILDMDLDEIPIFQKRISLKDINFFCKQFASMVQAGISVARALDICTQQCANKNLKKHLKNIHEEVTRGRTLSEAVRAEGIFPDILMSMIECGEASGNIDQVLNQTVDHFDNQLGVSKKIKKALTYPAIVLVVIVIVVIILMIKVVPNFMSLLTETGAETPMATKIVIAVSDFMIAHGLALGCGAVALIFICSLIPKTKIGRKALDKLSLVLPVMGPLNKKSISSTFASTMSMLVESGIPMLQAMEITKKVINNYVAGTELDKAMDSLKQGSSLYDALQGSVIYPPILFSMINVGEETGSLDEMLIKISVYFKEEVDMAVDNLTMMIEPLLTIVMAVVVGGIMLAIMQPTFSAATAIM